MIGYVRVSTDEQDRSGLGQEAQRKMIRAECKRRGWQLVRFEEDVASGKTLRGRVALEAALAACESGEVDGIVVAKLDRLTRSTRDLSTLIERATGRKGRRRFQLIPIDMPELDMSTANGEMFASMVVVLAQWERRIIGERTKAAMAVAAERRAANGEAPFGRPARHQVPDELRARLRSMRESGMGLRTIARTLNEEGVPTAIGKGTWHPATVRSALEVERRRREKTR